MSFRRSPSWRCHAAAAGVRDRGGSNCLHVGRRRRPGDRDVVVVRRRPPRARRRRPRCRPRRRIPPTTIPPTTLAPTTTTAPPPPDNSVLRRGAEGPFVGLSQRSSASWASAPGEVDDSYTRRDLRGGHGVPEVRGSRPPTATPDRITMAALRTGSQVPDHGRARRRGSRSTSNVRSRSPLPATARRRSSTSRAGNGKRYDRPQGGVGVADTPRGSYDIERRIDGVRVAPLGKLYRPLYFKGGFAIHGSSTCPDTPRATAACARRTRTRTSCGARSRTAHRWRSTRPEPRGSTTGDCDEAATARARLCHGGWHVYAFRVRAVSRTLVT